ncbi:MAG TPA: trehalose-phosphatase [Vicinamibacterales bacterium]|nr:trehalose-phosphatase [Vicinamibacterales bacterium]
MSAAEQFAQEVRRRAGGKRLLVLLDFDGTLTEFDPDPDAVRLPDQRRELIERLRQRAVVGIVSGRRLDDVRQKCGLADGLIVAGMHGLEIEAFGERFVHPDLAAAREAVGGAAAALRELAAPLDGAFVEDKEYSVVVHFRESGPEAQKAAVDGFAKIAEPHVERGRLRVMRGSCVLELLPNIDWNKGHAVRWIRERAEHRHGPCFVVYVGDDVTDQDAFAAIEEHGFPIAASERVTANARLDGPAEVERFLRALSG